MWLFHLHSTVKISPFLQFSHWRNLQLRHLTGYSFGTLKKGSVMVCGCFISTARWKYGFFIRFSHWRNPQLKHFVGYPFGTSKKKASTAFYGTAFKKSSKRWMSRRGMGTPFLSWLCQSTWLFHLHNTLKIQPFLKFSPWRTLWLRHFTGYSLGTS